MILDIKQNGGFFSDKYYRIDTDDVMDVRVSENYFSYFIRLFMADGRVIKLKTPDWDKVKAVLDNLGYTIRY